jgi:YHS domain-containing protein
MMLIEEDPVCNHMINVRATTWWSRYHGKEFGFCSLECRERFELEPDAYIPLAESSSVMAAALLHMVS